MKGEIMNDTNEINYCAVEWIRIDTIIVDRERLQMRTEIDNDYVHRLSGIIQDFGTKTIEPLSPFDAVKIIKVEEDGSVKLYLVGGFHRLAAFKRYDQLKKINAKVSSKVHTIKEAMLEAASDNRKNSRAYTPDDVKNGIYKLRELEMTHKELGKIFGYSGKMISYFCRRMLMEPGKYPLFRYKGMHNTKLPILTNSKVSNLEDTQDSEDNNEYRFMTRDEVLNSDADRDSSKDIVSFAKDTITNDKGVECKISSDGKLQPINRKTEPKPPKEDVEPLPHLSASFSAEEREWISRIQKLFFVRPESITFPSVIEVVRGESRQVLHDPSQTEAWRIWDWRNHFEFTANEEDALKNEGVVTVGDLAQVVAGKRKVAGFGEKRIETLETQFDEFWGSYQEPDKIITKG